MEQMADRSTPEPLVRAGLSLFGLCFFFFSASSTNAQTTSSSGPPSAAVGVETPWQARKTVEDLNRDIQVMKPLLDQIDTQRWFAEKGAPGVYSQQADQAKGQVKDILKAISQLAGRADNLSLSLDTYFRLEALDITARSLAEGAHKYDDRTVADNLSAAIARNFNDREHFRQYMQELAVSKEQDFKIADQEAQRCRGMISKELPPKSTRKSK